MKKVIGIIVCLWVVTTAGAVEFAPAAPFRSTSAYGAHGEQYQQQMMTANSRPQSIGSLSAISASNFEALNSEGGAFYSPSQTSSAPSGPRKGRIGGGDEETNPGGGGGEIGNDEVRSPIGDTPWLIMLLLGVGYIAFLTFRRQTHNP